VSYRVPATAAYALMPLEPAQLAHE
jgi:hypothetical protein